MLWLVGCVLGLGRVSWDRRCVGGVCARGRTVVVRVAGAWQFVVVAVVCVLRLRAVLGCVEGSSAGWWDLSGLGDPGSRGSCGRGSVCAGCCAGAAVRTVAAWQGVRLGWPVCAWVGAVRGARAMRSVRRGRWCPIWWCGREFGSGCKGAPGAWCRWGERGVWLWWGAPTGLWVCGGLFVCGRGRAVEYSRCVVFRRLSGVVRALGGVFACGGARLLRKPWRRERAGP